MSGGNLLKIGTLGVQSRVDGGVSTLAVEGDTIILLQNHLQYSHHVIDLRRLTIIILIIFISRLPERHIEIANTKTAKQQKENCKNQKYEK